MCTCSLPEIVYPTWRCWHVRVPLIGATSFDHTQPGWNTKRPTGTSSRRTTSMRPWGKLLTSSGVAKFFLCRRGIEAQGARPNVPTQTAGGEFHQA
jgi:hypothetical protein